jgi:hypothetical protein
MPSEGFPIGDNARLGLLNVAFPYVLMSLEFPSLLLLISSKASMVFIEFLSTSTFGGFSYTSLSLNFKSSLTIILSGRISVYLNSGRLYFMNF